MKSKSKSFDYCWGGTPWKITGTSTFGRWHEAPRNVFRFVGTAYDILDLRHKGWFVNDFQDETTEGLVFQLPHNRFLAAGSDANNEGSAYFEVKENGEPYIYDSKEEAARNADRLAELYAESEREFQAKEMEEMRQQAEEEEKQELESAFDFAS